VNGAVPLGYAPPDNTSTTVTNPQILLGNQPMNVTYSGLAPGSVGIYLVNAVAPSKLTVGASSIFALTEGGQTAAWIPQ
jgi:uncharacterized protein (TIGR03437 family)